MIGDSFSGEGSSDEDGPTTGSRARGLLMGIVLPTAVATNVVYNEGILACAAWRGGRAQ